MADKKASSKPAAKAKSSAPAPDPAADKVTQLVEATASRLMAARPAPEAPVAVPGVTQGGKPGPRAHVVGAPMAFGDLSPAALKKLVAAGIKSSLELAIRFGGGTLEDLAVAQRETLEDFVPDEFYEFIERLSHKMHGGDPHVVGGVPPSGPTAA